ncbi:hypothetical protein MTX25_12210 [Bradyrhizobium sp. ISRA432]|uniref:hypothetical protein n=1 Tax=Bradyrhizobium sp. ISRA442 TaxID=2866197 RepID=UPI00279E1857|nr:hypothetical protein MTX25_12210 [Bradyrhizobium sp. ISRA432]
MRRGGHEVGERRKAVVLHPQHIAARTRLKVGDGIGAVPLRDDESIRACSSGQKIVSGATKQDVRTGGAADYSHDELLAPLRVTERLPRVSQRQHTFKATLRIAKQFEECRKN